MKLSHITLTAIVVLSTSACALEFNRPSQLEGARVSIEEGLETSSYETSQLDEKMIKRLAHEYAVQGNGVVELTVSYDPKSKKNTAMGATLEAGRIASVLTDNGVAHVETKVLPIANSWNTSRTFLSYTTLTAHAPENCDLLPGYENVDDVGKEDLHKEYGYGCTTESLLAKQIAYPEDLLGRDDQTRTDDGRRAENVVSGRGYYGSDRYPELGGESSSE